MDTGKPTRGLAADVGKREPFDAVEQEVYLNLCRAHERCTADFDRLFKRRKLSQAQYNVLRILRGSRNCSMHPHGLRVQLIAKQMVTREPDVTRLIDRLEKQGLAERKRCTEDRRVVYVSITDAGMDVLRELDEPLLQTHASQFSHMTREELVTLNDLLYRASKPVQDDA